MLRFEITFTDKHEGADCVSVDFDTFDNGSSTDNEHKAANRLSAVIHQIIKRDMLAEVYEYVKEQQSPIK